MSCIGQLKTLLLTLLGENSPPIPQMSSLRLHFFGTGISGSYDVCSYDWLLVKIWLNINVHTEARLFSVPNDCLWYDKLWGPSQRVVTLFHCLFIISLNLAGWMCNNANMKVAYPTALTNKGWHFLRITNNMNRIYTIRGLKGKQ